MINIREYQDADWKGVWRILKPVFRAGETYAYPVDISQEDARAVWVSAPTQTLVAEEAGEILGTYYLKPNQPSLGAHVCNCGYAVGDWARGRGLATLMCKHSQERAKQADFQFMQFNLVATINEGAVRLWKRLGFVTIGTLPKAFRHATLGPVDAHVMYKEL